MRACMQYRGQCRPLLETAETQIQGKDRRYRPARQNGIPQITATVVPCAHERNMVPFRRCHLEEWILNAMRAKDLLQSHDVGIERPDYVHSEFRAVPVATGHARPPVDIVGGHAER